MSDLENAKPKKAPEQKSELEQFSEDGNARPSSAEPREKSKFSGGGEKASDYRQTGDIGGVSGVSGVGGVMSEEEWDKAIGETGIVYDNVHSHYYRKALDG